MTIEEEREIIVRWIIENVYANDVPGDESNDEALMYNLIHLAKEGRPYRKYNYQPDQDREIEEWNRQREEFEEKFKHQ